LALSVVQALETADIGHLSRVWVRAEGPLDS
jgi:hypothetical protein